MSNQEQYKKREEQSASAGGIFQRDEAKAALPTPSKGPCTPTATTTTKTPAKNLHSKWQNLHLNWKRTVTPESLDEKPSREKEDDQPMDDQHHHQQQQQQHEMLNLSPLSSSTTSSVRVSHIPRLHDSTNVADISMASGSPTPEQSFKPYGPYTPPSRGARTSRLEAYTSMPVYDRLYRQANVPPSPMRADQIAKHHQANVTKTDHNVLQQDQMRKRESKIPPPVFKYAAPAPAQNKTAKAHKYKQPWKASSRGTILSRTNPFGHQGSKNTAKITPPKSASAPSTPSHQPQVHQKQKPWKSPSRSSILSKTNPFSPRSEFMSIAEFKRAHHSSKSPGSVAKRPPSTTANITHPPQSASAPSTPSHQPQAHQKQKPWKSPSKSSMLSKANPFSTGAKVTPIAPTKAKAPNSTTPQAKTPNSKATNTSRTSSATKTKTPQSHSGKAASRTPSSQQKSATNSKTPMTTYQIRKLASQRLKERQQAETEAKKASEEAESAEKAKKKQELTGEIVAAPDFDLQSPTQQRLAHPEDISASAPSNLDTSSPSDPQRQSGSRTPPSLDMPALDHKTSDTSTSSNRSNPIIEAVQAVRTDNDDSITLLQSASLAIKRFQAVAVLQRWWRGTLTRSKLGKERKEENRFAPKSPQRHTPQRPVKDSTPLSPATAAAAKGRVQSAYRESHSSVQQKHEFVHIYHEEHHKQMHEDEQSHTSKTTTKAKLQACRKIIKAWRQYRERFELYEEKRKAAEMLQLCWWRDLSKEERNRIETMTTNGPESLGSPFSQISSDIQQFVRQSREASVNEQKGSQLLQLCWWRSLSTEELERIANVPKVTKYSKMPGQVKDFIVSSRQERLQTAQAATVLQKFWRRSSTASQQGGLDEIPKLVEDASDTHQSVSTTTENINQSQVDPKIPETRRPVEEGKGSALRGVQQLAQQVHTQGKDDLQSATETTEAKKRVQTPRTESMAKPAPRQTKLSVKPAVTKSVSTVTKTAVQSKPPKSSPDSIDLVGIYRRAFRVRKDDLLKKRNRRVKAARTIQQWWTMSCLVRRYLGNRRVASIQIQTVYRGYRYYMVYYLLQCNVIMIQRWWRLCRSGKVQQIFKKKSSRKVWKVQDPIVYPKVLTQTTPTVQELQGAEEGGVLQRIKFYFVVLCVLSMIYTFFLFIALVYVDGIISVKHEGI